MKRPLGNHSAQVRQQRIAHGILFSLASLLLLGNAWWAASLEELAATVVFLHDTKAGVTHYGTGFFVVSGDKMFLVTANHMVGLLGPEAQGTVQLPGDKAFTFTLRELAGGGKSALQWRRHDHADAAVARLHPAPAFIEAHLQGRFLNIATLEPSLVAPPREIPLTVLGFPLRLGTTGAFSPISRETKAASGILEVTVLGDKNPSVLFLTQDPSVGGFSGAPVFDTGQAIPTAEGGLEFRPGVLTVYGLAKGTISDETGGKMAAIVPSCFIVELLQDTQPSGPSGAGLTKKCN